MPLPQFIPLLILKTLSMCFFIPPLKKLIDGVIQDRLATNYFPKTSLACTGKSLQLIIPVFLVAYDMTKFATLPFLVTAALPTFILSLGGISLKHAIFFPIFFSELGSA